MHSINKVTQIFLKTYLLIKIPMLNIKTNFKEITLSNQTYATYITVITDRCDPDFNLWDPDRGSSLTGRLVVRIS